jgi:hypothetical protein
VFLLYTLLLLRSPQQEHTSHLLRGDIAFEAQGNLLQGEPEVLERENAMEP